MENKTNKLINMLSGNLRAFLETEIIVVISMGILAIAAYIAADINGLIDIVIYFMIVTIIVILLYAISLYQDLKRLKDDKK